MRELQPPIKEKKARLPSFWLWTACLLRLLNIVKNDPVDDHRTMSRKTTLTKVCSGVAEEPLPSNQHGAISESGSEGIQQEQLPLLNTTVSNGFIHHRWNGRRRRIGITIDVDQDLLGRKSQTLSYSFQNPLVGLVGNKPVNILDTEPLAS